MGGGEGGAALGCANFNRPATVKRSGSRGRPTGRVYSIGFEEVILEKEICAEL